MHETQFPRPGEGPRGIQDLGGAPAGPIDRSPHEPGLFEKRVDAMYVLLQGKRAFTTDAHRRVQETMPQHEYDTLAYYERWMASIRTLLVEQGILSDEEIEARIRQIREGGT
jgi:hypothetical protein